VVVSSLPPPVALSPPPPEPPDFESLQAASMQVTPATQRMANQAVFRMKSLFCG
jgi:hypothetical protein